MKKVISLTAIGMLSILATAPQPAKADTAGLSVNPWQQCGIGAMIFPDHGIAAAISNIIWDLGTTAVTSATVSEETCEGRDVIAAKFIDENYDQVESELAIGEGRHVNAMLTLLGCEGTQQDAVITQLRSNLVIDSEKTKSEKAEALYFSAQSAVAQCKLG